MEALLLRILNMSIGAGWLILAAVLFRLVFRNAPKRFRCIVWALVAVRLVCPLTIRSSLSLVPTSTAVTTDLFSGAVPQEVCAEPEQPEVRTDYPIVDALLRADQTDIRMDVSSEFGFPTSSGGSDSDDRSLRHSLEIGPFPLQIEERQPHALGGAENETVRGSMKPARLTAVWIGGATVMLAYTVFSYIRIRKKTKVREALPGNIIRCDEVETPFILGIFRPRIVIPTGISEYDAYFAVAHEKAHLERRDHLIKPFAFLLLAVHWFNPLMWLGYILLSRDIELACDERVIRSGGAELKKRYSIALINCSIPASAVSACPVAFGEIGVKARVRSVLSYSKPKWTTVTAAVLCCAAIAVFFLTSPVKGLDDPASESGAASVVTDFSSDKTDYDRFYVFRDDGAGIDADENILLSISSNEHRFRIDYPDGESSLGTFSYKAESRMELTDDKSGRKITFRKQGNDLVIDGEAQTVSEAGSVFELFAICSQQEYLFICENNGFAYYPDTGTLLVYGDFETAYSLLNDRLPNLPSGKSAAVRDALNAAFASEGELTVKSSMMAAQLTPLGESYGECTAMLSFSQQQAELVIFTAPAAPDTSYKPGVTHTENRLTPGSKFVNGSRRYPWW
ncbi:MAG: M56 family metallopeptidase [Clostridia bacterium]|nr:M56 family metallopeptidase [Clostridia bacterium]